MTQAFIYPNWPLRDKVNAFTTTRTGGVSSAPFDSFNLAMHVKDNVAAVSANRQQLQQCFSDHVQIKWLKQVHGSEVVNAAVIDADQVEADAAFAIDENIACAVLTADCLPILLSDENGECVAAVHAGWRGIINGVINNTIVAMSKHVKPSYAWLGPAIGPNVFEVGADVYEAYGQTTFAFNDCFIEKNKNSKKTVKWNLNIYQAAKVVLNAADICNVYGGEYCTFSDSDQFYSYRRNALTGRMATIISKR